VTDTKDWTWVLERPCAECGFDASTLARERIGATSRTAVARLADDVGGDGLVGQRPQPEIWSTLEYMVHDLVHHVWDIDQSRAARPSGPR